jgi:hypothetical protein
MGEIMGVRRRADYREISKNGGATCNLNIKESAEREEVASR